MKRRAFLRKSALVATGFLANSASARTTQANDKLNLAWIGAGGRGQTLMRGFVGKETTVAALCDVNEVRTRETYARFPGVPKFKDFRKMLDVMGDRIDAVVIATPDHTHAIATAASMRAGKHVYTEKPLSRTVEEARVLRELAGKYGVATSMGNQGTATGPFRRALELIRGGTLGTIRDVHVWNAQGGPGWTKPPEGEAEVPSTLAWDLWLGPAAARPYHLRWMNNFKLGHLRWQYWRDFGTGNLGDWASHTSNLAFMALRVDSLWQAKGATLRVEAEVDARNRLSFPRWERVRWDIPARGDLPPLRFHWYNGSRMPGMRENVERLLGRGLDWGDKGEKKWADKAGCLIIGTEGKLHATSHNASFTLLPEEKFKDVMRDRPERVAHSLGHDRDWLTACRGGEPPWARFEYAGPLTEFNILGNVATQFEGPLIYDPATGRITNHEEADRALRPLYRKGWSL